MTRGKTSEIPAIRIIRDSILKQILNQLFDQQLLTHAEAREAMLRIGQGEANPAEMAAFMTVYRMRPISVPELAGFRPRSISDNCAGKRLPLCAVRYQKTRVVYSQSKPKRPAKGRH